MSWKEEFGKTISDALVDIESFADTTWRRFAKHLELDQPRSIAAYGGYGNSETIWISGRLLANPSLDKPRDDDRWWDNLQASYQRWQSHELPGEEVRLRFGNVETSVVTDEEGYYQASIERAALSNHRSSVLAIHENADGTIAARHDVTLIGPEAEFIVISDVDDTVIHTHNTALLQAARLTFLGNARTRKPLAGASVLYNALSHGEGGDNSNPIIYLSNSPWNLYDLLRDFLDLNAFPEGPLLLRDLGIGSDSSDHKTNTMRELFARTGNLPIVLIGDSGQNDAKYYSSIAGEFPDRVKAIYIRDVDPGRQSKYDSKVDNFANASKQFEIPFLRVSDSVKIADHAAGLGLIPTTAVADISKAVSHEVGDDQRSSSS